LHCFDVVSVGQGRVGRLVAGYWGEFVVSIWGELVDGAITSPTWDELVGRIDIAAK